MSTHHTGTLLLPSHLQGPANRPTNERQSIRRQDVGAGKTVTLDRVYMKRNGWRYEVNAEYIAGDGSHTRDTLWLPDHDQAQRLFRAAAAALVRSPSEFAKGGLSALGRDLELRFALS